MYIYCELVSKSGACVVTLALSEPSIKWSYDWFSLKYSALQCCSSTLLLQHIFCLCPSWTHRAIQQLVQIVIPPLYGQWEQMLILCPSDWDMKLNFSIQKSYEQSYQDLIIPVLPFSLLSHRKPTESTFRLLTSLSSFKSQVPIKTKYFQDSQSLL